MWFILQSQLIMFLGVSKVQPLTFEYVKVAFFLNWAWGNMSPVQFLNLVADTVRLLFV